MKNKIWPTGILFFLASLGLKPANVFGQVSNLQKQIGDAQTAGLPNTSIYDIILSALQYLLGIVGILAIVMIVFAGIMYMASTGEEEQIEKAKKMLTYAIVGLVIALLGLVVVSAIFTILGVGDCFLFWCF